MRGYVLPSLDPCFNLAQEEVFMLRQQEAFLLWRNRSCVIVGRNQNVCEEIDIPFAEKMRIPFFRRISGGGAVYHDLGTINFSLITRLNEGESLFSAFVLPKIVDDYAVSSRNDVLLGGKKIIGTARCACHGMNLFHGSLLYDTDLEILEKVLTPSPGKLLKNGIKSVRERVENLKHLQALDLSADAFFCHLCEMFRKDISFDRLPASFDDFSREVAKAKFCKRSWNAYGET